MRGNERQGRFKIPFEIKSNEEGIVDDLRLPVGTDVGWWVFSPTALAENFSTWVDPIYDVSNQTTYQGVQWNEPITLPVISAQVTRGDSEPNERGFYTVDTLRLVVAVADLEQYLPDMIANPTEIGRAHV